MANKVHCDACDTLVEYDSMYRDLVYGGDSLVRHSLDLTVSLSIQNKRDKYEDHPDLCGTCRLNIAAKYIKLVSEEPEHGN